jgi:cation diffusion facilitator family transporter
MSLGPQAGRVRTLAVASIAVAFAVMALKFVAWRLTGSVALYSDALESIVNVIAATAAFMAIRYAYRPADISHPFGHHKAEYFSAVVEGVLIVVAALLIMHSASQALLNPVSIERPGPGLAINGFAAAINGAFATLLIRTGRQARSPALVADGRHIMADVVTTAGVIAGLLLAIATGWAWLDPVLAIAVAFNIVREGWKVISESVNGLMDRAADTQTTLLIEQTIRAGADGAIEVHDIKTRAAGPATFIEFHLVVDRTMTVEMSHRICDRIEESLRKSVPGARVTIHVEPDYKSKHEGLAII